MEKDKIIQIIYWKNPKEGYLDYFYGLSENGNIYITSVPDSQEFALEWKLLLEGPEKK